MGNLWLVGYLAGQYWAQPNYTEIGLQDWTLLQGQNGPLAEPVRVPSSAITFIKTAVQLPPLAGPQPQSFQIGL